MRRNLIPLLLVASAACKEEVAPLVYQALPVETRSISVSVRAAGNVQPDTVVEVKSKASGEILQRAVETGQYVSRGQLLVQVDQRTPRNSLAQTEAELEVAKARLANAEAQKLRHRAQAPDVVDEPDGGHDEQAADEPPRSPAVVVKDGRQARVQQSVEVHHRQAADGTASPPRRGMRPS